MASAPTKLQLEEMLNAMGLPRRSRISLWDVMTVRELKTQKSSSALTTNASSTESCSIAELPMLMLRKILMMDFNGREEYFRKLRAPEAEVSVTDFLLGDEVLQKPSQVKRDRLSPIDVLVLTYNCCHPLLQQLYMEKLFACKLAVPFIHRLNDCRLGIPSWALRSIIIEWKAKGKVRERSVIDCAIPIMSFVRIGRPKFSKSDLLNFILNENSHKTFFCHNCTGGLNARVVSDGLVEAAWFFPSDRDPGRNMMILNLRGNAVEHTIQSKYLTTVSSLMVVVISVEELSTGQALSFIRQVLSRNVNLVVLLTPCSEQTNVAGLKSAFKDVRSNLPNEAFAKIRWVYGFTIEGTKVNIPDLKCKILEEANLRASQSCVTLREWIKMGGTDEFRFVVDEEDNKIRLTKLQAEDVFESARKEELQNVRRLLLPLQGSHWKRYSQLVKEFSSVTESDSRERHHRNQIQERNDQLKILIKQLRFGNPLMQKFTSYLLKYASSNDEDNLMFLLHWLKLYMDDHTREHLPAAAKEYQDVVRQLRAEKKEEAPNLEKIKTLEKEETEKERILSESSFGLEHVMREVAQVYEAVKEYDDGSDSQNEIRSEYEALPLAAAKLLLWGFPLELMDGDVANVPITWIRSVLRHAQTLVGDKKVFVLSVLGIQSSGKSTLLNTMFGLRFAVSAGRCTRGIFMQLVPVDPSTGYKFDYMLVVDTEGLRSSELQSQHYRHDNELATLAIGLGDLTILNIKGEDLTEVKEVLEIVVQAFLKMKVANAGLNLKKSCMFVHQNVSAVNAASQMEHGHLKLQNMLDKMTEEAARQVHKVAIRSFNQVINYDGEKHILYFSDLWKGDPPMAPANPGYSTCAHNLRNLVMEGANSRQALLYSFSNFSQHVEDLWRGIICQDFIFSFRNCLEIKAYTRLEDLYCELKVQVDQFTSDWVARTARVRLSACGSEDELDDAYSDLLDKLSSEVRKKGNTCLEELESYFSSTEDLSLISIQWKGERNKTGFLGRFSKFVFECVDKANCLIRGMKDTAALSLKKKRNDKVHRDKILHRARQFAERLIGPNLSDELIAQKFEETWALLEHDMVVDCSSSKRPIFKVLEELLYETMTESADIIRMELILNPISQGINVGRLEDAVTTDAIRIDLLDVECTEELEKCRKDAVEFLKLRFAAIENKINNSPFGDDPFQDSFARQFLQQLKEAIRKKNALVYDQPSVMEPRQESPCRYAMPDNFTAMVLVTAARYMNERFEEMQEEYESKHGVKAILREFRKEGFIVFESTALQAIAEVSSADSFWSKMCDLVRETVLRQIQDRIPNEVKEDFCLAKHHLIKTLLIDLASNKADRRQQFANYVSYITDAASFALTWITNYTNNKYFRVSEGKTQFGIKCSSLLDRLLNDVMESVENATEAIKDTLNAHLPDSGMTKPGMQDWVKTFCENMRVKEFAINTFDLSFLIASACTSINFEDFRSYIRNKQNQICETLKKDFFSLDQSMEWMSAPPYQTIFDFLWGCRSQCPFCKEPCRYMSDHDKEHMCIQHRPQCIGGWRTIRTHVLATETCNSKVRNEEGKFLCIHKPVEDVYNDLNKGDLAFLFSATEGMKPYVERLGDDIETMIADIRKEQPDVQLNLAFVGYRDHSDADKGVTFLPLTNDVKKFKSFVEATEAFCGGYGASNYFGGLEEVDKLAWKSPSRILYHLADTPCHGAQFQNNKNCNGDASDVRKVRIESLFSNLKRQNVQYCFGKITNSTDQMISECNKVAGVDFINVRDANLSSLLNLVAETVTSSLRRILNDFEDGGNIEILPGSKCNQVWHLNKDYKKCAEDWEIAPEQSTDTTLYWQRFLHNFQEEIKVWYSAKTSNFDPAWANIGLQRALESLDSLRG